MHMYMTKVISLSDEAYSTLKKMKRNGDSFSKVILRMAKTEERTSLAAFAGKWATEDIDEVFEAIMKERKAGVTREAKV